jgi:bifunctional DNase/RNase
MKVRGNKAVPVGMKEVYISGIALDRERDFPVVLIKSEDGDEVLPIWIGAAEATAIYTALTGKTFERPMTHDLMRLIIEELGAVVNGIEITGIHEDTYFARIVLQRGEELFYLDARPSDSIALALRSGSSIRVDENLFENCKRKIHVNQEGGKGKKDGLEQIDPDDLFESDH